MEPSFLLRFNVTLRHLLMRYYYKFDFSISTDGDYSRILAYPPDLTNKESAKTELKVRNPLLLQGLEIAEYPDSGSCKEGNSFVSEVHTADQLPLPRYGLDAPPARAGLSDGYDRTIEEEGRRFQSEALTEGCACPWPHLPIFDYGENLCSSHSSAFRLSYGISVFFGEADQASKSVLRSGIVPIGLAASGNLFSCPKSKKQVTPNPPEGGSKATSEGDWIKPERISDRLEDPVSNAPLAFNSQGELSASSLVPRGEGPSNSEVGSQYTDTPVIDRDLSLVTGEHSEGKPALAFSTPTGISLGGSSEPLTLSPDHKPLGGWKSSAIRESSSSFAGTLFSKASTWDNLSLGYDLNSTFKKEPDQANQEIGSDEGERELLLKEGESLLLVAIKCNLTYMLLSPCFITPITADEAKDIDYLFRRTKNKIKAANSPASVGGRNGQIHTDFFSFLP
ncbi:hypothetical protein E3N88_46085 [Mikania micrantha]|uniref:Uncharacterized protein n=1 Tax=Mikania micrantha TaxID=192012 RepID=A0A5N6L7J4_9ASTR|nr:hypothetical protein E3N88_46085 [Mikania micrantha]